MDFLLDDIIKSGRLWEDTKSLCSKYQLNNLEEIYNFIISEQLNVEIEGIKSYAIYDLLRLYLDYIKYSDNNNLILTLPIHLLAIYEKMSQRTLNICIDAGFTNLHSILKYRNQNIDFKKLRNCGQISNDELTLIYKNYKNLDISYSDEKTDSELLVNELFSNGSFDDISLQTLANIEKMSVRSYNVCDNANLTSLKQIMQFYYQNFKSQFLCIRNCGEKANNELVSICQKYEKLLTSSKVLGFNESDSQKQIGNFLRQIKLNFDYDLVKQSIYDFNFIPFFRILDLLIENNCVFNKEKQVQVFKMCFNCYFPLEDYTLDEIGSLLGVTRERIRQIRTTVSRKMSYGFNFINNIQTSNLLPQYLIATDKPFIYIDIERVSQINTNEGTNFSPNFITFIFSLLLRESHIRLGELTTIFSNIVFKKNCFDKHIYLINRRIAEDFNFKNFHFFLKSTISERRKEDIKITYDMLLRKFSKQQPVYTETIIEIVNFIVNKDFNEIVEVNEDGFVIFRNARRTFTSYITEILQNSYKPLHYSEIYQQMIDSGINIASEQSVHSVLLRESELFGLKGFGIYDLRSKGGLFGTIGDVAEQLLIKSNVPIKLQELENLICKELVVSKDSISVVLFSYNNENRFIRDRSGYVKLKKCQKVQI